jgi:hypothetical protein
LSTVLWLSIKSKKHHIKLTYTKLLDNAWILTHILQMEGNTVGCSRVLHHVLNPTLTSTRCFILGSLVIYDGETGHEILVSASNALLVHATTISKFKSSFIILPLKSTSHHHNIFPGNPFQYSSRHCHCHCHRHPHHHLSFTSGCFWRFSKKILHVLLL